MISRIKVANNAKLLKINVQNSKICMNILTVLYRLGYIRGFTIINKKVITVLLKYTNNNPTIRNIYVVSTPGRRVYLKYNELLKQIKKKDSGFYLLSTSKGILTDEEVTLFNVGGEVLLKIN
jgi:small subunit ribosomal protein S8